MAAAAGGNVRSPCHACLRQWDDTGAEGQGRLDGGPKGGQQGESWACLSATDEHSRCEHQLRREYINMEGRRNILAGHICPNYFPPILMLQRTFDVGRDPARGTVRDLRIQSAWWTSLGSRDLQVLPPFH